MADAVSFVLQVTVNNGKKDDAKALMTELVAASKAESGTTDYDWYASDDGSAVHIYERYTDNAALMLHLGNFGANFAERFMGCFTPTALNVYGNASDDVRAALKPFGAVYLAPLGGFHR